MGGTIEELVGCHPSMCHYSELDAIVKLVNGSRYLVLRDWMWEFHGFNGNVVNSKPFMQNFTKYPYSPNYLIQEFIEGSFIYDGRLHFFMVKHCCQTQFF